MNLRRIVIENFRGIEHFEWDFTDDFDRVRPVTVIVGPNGSGKTAILDAIWFGLMGALGYSARREGLQQDVEHVVRHGADYARVEYDLDIPEVQSEDLAAWLQATYPAGFSETTARLQWGFPALPDDSRGSLVRGTYTFESQTSEMLLQAWRQLDKTRRRSVEKLPQNVGGVYLFDEDRRVEGEPVFSVQQTAHALQKLATSKADIRAVLIDLGIKHLVGKSQEALNQYRRIQDGFHRICHTHRMGDVYAVGDNDRFEIEFFDEAGRQYGFDSLSSGERSVLNFLVRYVALRMSHAIVLIDEIETHLHPPWQRRLLYFMTHNSDHNQFVITTHSPTIESAVPRDAVIQLGSLDDIPDWQWVQVGDAEDA